MPTEDVGSDIRSEDEQWSDYLRDLAERLREVLVDGDQGELTVVGPIILSPADILFLLSLITGRRKGIL